MELKSINREEQKIKDKRKKEGKNIILSHSFNNWYIFRQSLLSAKPVDITPTNAERKFLWSKAQSLDQFENDWSFRPV